ncbi:hypothetical protein HD554DRAFT_2037427 [Boletus coccyginus]|nr:hypothetical protein HD554DRAFT_2037427 [Boletus coccyginus]
MAQPTDEPLVAYGLPQYLLDRINIHDTITRLTTRSSRAKNLKCQGRPAKEEAESWAKYFERFTAAQHVMTCILVNLPQPAPAWNIATPNKATASATALVTLRRDRARGETIAQHGSYYTFDLTRQTGVDPGSNPWRISHMKVHPFWFRGNIEVMN